MSDISELIALLGDKATPEQVAKLQEMFKEEPKAPRAIRGVVADKDKKHNIEVVFKCKLCGTKTIEQRKSSVAQDVLHYMPTCSRCIDVLSSLSGAEVAVRAVRLLNPLTSVKQCSVNWAWSSLTDHAPRHATQEDEVLQLIDDISKEVQIDE